MRIFFIILTMIISFNLYPLEGLVVGQKAPDIVLTDIEGVSYKLNQLGKKTVLVFYRGSWCPYCMRQLQSIQSEIMTRIPKSVNLLGISVDRLGVAKKMKNKYKFTFSVVSDPKASSLKEFSIINKLSDKLIQKYKSAYQIDVEGDSGEKHHMVAHPAVFIISDGKIIFADVHTDYKKRTKNSEILRHLTK